MFPPPCGKNVARQACPCVKMPKKGGVARVPTPASTDLRVQKRQQGQTAGLDPGMKLRVRSQFMSGSGEGCPVGLSKLRA